METTTKINYERVFKMFCATSDYRKELTQPFIQSGNYFATDAYTLIHMNVNGELDVQEQERPNAIDVLPKELHEPIEIDVLKLKNAILTQAPLVDEYHQKERDCDECDGSGEVECDLGHDHDCERCDGEGVIAGKNPTGNKIPDEKTIFSFMDSYMRFPILMQLVTAAEILGVNKIQKIAGEGMKADYFIVGDTKILLMPCMQSDDKGIVELKM